MCYFDFQCDRWITREYNNLIINDVFDELFGDYRIVVLLMFLYCVSPYKNHSSDETKIIIRL